MSLLTSISAYYKLDDTSDSVGSRTLTNTNSVTFDAGLIGNAADFSSSNTNKMLSYATDAVGWTGGDLSLSFWVNSNATISSGQWYIADISNSSAGGRFNLYYDYNSGTRRIVMYGGTYTYNTTLTTGTWYHLVLTWKSSGGNLVVYLNGSSVITASSVSLSASGTRFSLGAAVDAGASASVKVDECGIWNRVLTSTEVTQLYNGGAGLQYPFELSTNATFLLNFI